VLPPAIRITDHVSRLPRIHPSSLRPILPPQLCRVGLGVAAQAPHRPVRAQLTHTVPQCTTPATRKTEHTTCSQAADHAIAHPPVEHRSQMSLVQGVEELLVAQRRERQLRRLLHQFIQPLLFRVHAQGSRCTLGVSRQRYRAPVRSFPPQAPAGYGSPTSSVLLAHYDCPLVHPAALRFSSRDRYHSRGDGRLSQVPGQPVYCASALFSDPAGPPRQAFYGAIGAARAKLKARASGLWDISGLYHTAQALAAYASTLRLPSAGKTRFRWGAGLYRVGLITHGAARKVSPSIVPFEGSPFSRLRLARQLSSLIPSYACPGAHDMPYAARSAALPFRRSTSNRGAVR